MSTATVHKDRNGTSPKPARPVATSGLLNGDHLSVPEFERRYEAMPGDGRAELIEGIVVMSPPISIDHAETHGLLVELLRRYARGTPGVVVGVNASVRLDGRNEFQPDIVLRIKGGKMARTRLDAQRLLEGSPELVVEIALSSRAYDLHEKKAVYQRNQIPEYFVWEVMDGRIHWFSLQEGDYVPLPAGPAGLRCSRIFPGLWLDVRAIVSGDEMRVFRALDRGLRSVEHKSFLKQLSHC